MAFSKSEVFSDELRGVGKAMAGGKLTLGRKFLRKGLKKVL